MADVLVRINKMVREGLMPVEALQALVDEYDPAVIAVIMDRTAALVYPDWVDKVLYPELEKTGPDRFYVTNLERWLHPKQVKGVVEGNEIHDDLKNKNLLEGCLGLAELEAIRKRGVVFFRKYFPGQTPFGWRSVVQIRSGGLHVPCLVESGGEVVVIWVWLGNLWPSRRPALRLANQLLDLRIL